MNRVRLSVQKLACGHLVPVYLASRVVDPEGSTVMICPDCRTAIRDEFVVDDPPLPDLESKEA